MAASVDGLHDPGPAPGDDCKAAVGERGTQRAAGLVVGIVVLGSSRPEDWDRRPDFVQRVKSLDELGEDAQHAPWIRMVAELLDRAALEQRAVGGRLLAGDDQSTGAAAVSAVPATGLVHQASGFDSSGSTSEAPSVATATGSGCPLRDFLAALPSPLIA